MMAALNTLTDQELVALLKQGSQTAFEQLYKNYSSRILKNLIRLLKDEEIAKEILQDLYLKIWEKRKTLDPEQSFQSFLLTIARNMVMDFFRRAASDRKMMDHLITISTELYYDEDAPEENTNDFVLQVAIDTLPEQRKRIFLMCKMERKSYEEVAGLLGITTGTVNDHMVKAMRTLRDHFGKSGMAVGLLVLKAFNYN